MSDPDEPPPDHCDSPSDYAKVEEVAAALDGLSALDMDKLESQARILVRGTILDPGDLINTVVERLLSADRDQRRHWHRKETLGACIYRTMKSLVRDHWRRQQLPLTPISDRVAGVGEDPDPETQLIARQELLSLLTALSDEKETSAIALALANGHSPADIRQRFRLTETEYDSALKRIRRRMLKYKVSGCQP